MVNTRRGLATENGPRYQTRKSNNAPELGSSFESDSGGQAGEESADEDESWSPSKVTKAGEESEEQPKLVPPRVRELRNLYICDKRKFGFPTHRTRELRSSHKHISVNERRRHLGLYSSHTHKMHDDLESEEDCYSPRHHSRRNRYSKSHIARIERRTALSLRPITRKFYRDPSPATCNSDESGFNKVRRSLRTRNPRVEKSMSWLTDDQMHKVGYPNLRRRHYSDEEDSLDAQNHRTTQKTLLDSNKHKGVSCQRKVDPQYIFSYEGEDLNSHHNVHDEDSADAKTEKKKARKNSRAESQDKENKEDNIINGRTNGRLRRSREQIVDNTAKEDDSSKDDAQADDKEDKDSNLNDDEGDDMEEKEDGEETSESEEDIRPVRPVRTTRSRQNKARPYGLRINRNRKASESSSSSERGAKPYSLRDRQPKLAAIIGNNSSSIHPRRRFNRCETSSSPSDSSDNDDIRKGNKYSSKNPHLKKTEPLKSGACSNKVAPINPEVLDPKITFDSVGGLDGHVQCLKEMILLPMMYPEVFKKFHIHPPRGVLFHGPPGTGKTLIARALANECSFGSRKVSFFMRKGADLLSKWMGESEKQLGLLFEQASELQPSIIFFDELDGLTPVRTSKQDHHHASIVSTLLALMDGLDNRGEVIVIGATNRVDAIDPALRRPGRFDRELFFPLPAYKEREEILKVHVSQWSAPPSSQLLSYLAESAVGYCGSDLRALCSEAVIQSFKRTYPQVYSANCRLLLDPENVKVEKLDFLRAKSMLVPASQRVAQNIGRKLPPILEPLLAEPIKNIMSMLEKSFPHGANANLFKVKISAGVRPAQFLILGDSFVHGHTTYLAPALLHRMEHVHAHTLNLTTLHGAAGSPAEACIRVFHEAKRNVPSIIYIPNIDLMWSLASETVLAIFVAQILQITPNNPILILATADTLYKNLPNQITQIFSKYRNEVYEMKLPSSESRRSFFRPLLVDSCLKPPRCPKRNLKTPPPLPRAPTPPPTPISKEAEKKLFSQEEKTLRELRIFLRDMCKKLASNRLFFMFTKPVDTEEVPDYPTIIKEPMDLETMMTKVDFHRYESAKDFLHDIELICQNALEYNPARTSADKQIRHRACALRDYAFALIKNEMDSDFEEKCQSISETRKKRKADIKLHLPPYLDTPKAPGSNSNVKDGKNEDTSKITSASTKTTPALNSSRVSLSKKRKALWKQGYVRKKKRRDRPVLTESHPEDHNDDKMSSGEESKENNPEAVSDNSAIKFEPMDDEEEKPETETTPDSCLKVTAPLTVNCDTTTSAILNIENNTILQSPQCRRRLSNLMSPTELLEDVLDFDDIDQALNEVTESTSPKSPIDISEEELENVLQQTVTVTTGESLQTLLDLSDQIRKIVNKFIRTSSRKSLTREIQNELKRFVKEKSHSNS